MWLKIQKFLTADWVWRPLLHQHARSHVISQTVAKSSQFGDYQDGGRRLGFWEIGNFNCWSIVKCLATSGYPDGSISGGPGFKSWWKREFWEIPIITWDATTLLAQKGTWCSAKQGCRVAQLVKCLATSGYPDGSRSGGPGFKSRWKRKVERLTSCSRGAWLSRDKQLSEVVLCKNAHVVWSHGDLGSSRSSFSS